MQTISSTEFNRRPARYFRQAEKRPIGVAFRGRTRCMLVPLDYAGIDPLDRIRFEDLPLTARFSRQDIVAWLMVSELDRLLRDHPTETLKVMRRTLQRYREVRSMRDDFIDRWEQLLDDGAPAILSALREDSDRGAHLRQIAPVSGLLGIADRERILSAANRLLAEKRTIEKRAA
jgi:hypothetical protein